MYNWNTLPREVLGKAGSRVGFRGENTMFVMNFISPGIKTPPHTHDFEQVVICVAGRMSYHVGDQVFEMTAGSMLRVPPHTEHYVEVLGDEVALNLDVFPSIREDYRHLVAHQAHEFAESERQS
jgi:quercetin dioxygenase-like cupin family protein